MLSKRASIAAAALATLVCPWLFAQKVEENHPNCEAPEYFGICDPFVPGMIVGRGREGGIRVNSTWPEGPADQAGVCPGDEVVVAGGVLVRDHTLSAILRGFVSDEPTPLDVKIKRGGDDLSFHLPRVRESTLAFLSKQKFAKLPFFPRGELLVTVPLDESPEEVEAFREAELRVGQHYGFKLAGDGWVPEATPKDQLGRLAEIQSDPSWPQRSASEAVLVGYPFGAGFSALLLRNPEEVLVDRIVPASPAYRAGLLPGDQLLDVDGQGVSGLNGNQLTELVSKPDDRPRELTLGVRRGTAVMKLTLDTQHTDEFAYLLSMFGELHRPQRPSVRYISGLQEFDADAPRQVIVTGVEYPSPAFEAGLHVGDLLLAVNAKPIDQIAREQLSQLLEPTGPSELTLEVSRLGRKLAFRLVAVTEAAAQAKIGRKMTENGPASAHCPEAPRPNEPPKAHLVVPSAIPPLVTKPD